MAARLETLLKEIEVLHKQKIIPFSPRITMKKKTISRLQPHEQLGSFYELLTQAIKGGQVTDMNHKKKHMPDDPFFPDVVNGKNHYESKAARRGHYCTLTHVQVKKYRLHQIENEDSSVSHMIFRHGKTRIRSYKGTSMELFRELAMKTYFGIELPLSLVHELVDDENDLIEHTHLKRNIIYPDATNIGSTLINGLLMKPENTIGKIYTDKGKEYDKTRFSIRREITPPFISIQNIPVTPFLLIRIIDTQPEVWIKELSLMHPSYFYGR